MVYPKRSAANLGDAYPRDPIIVGGLTVHAPAYACPEISDSSALPRSFCAVALARRWDRLGRLLRGIHQHGTRRGDQVPRDSRSRQSAPVYAATLRPPPPRRLAL